MNKYVYSFFSLLKFPKHLFFLFWVYIRFFLGVKTKPFQGVWRDFDINKTFIRWWDGETMVALGIPMVFYFQFERSSKRLANKMKAILSYEGDDIIIWLPKEFLIQEEDKTPHIRAWIITRNLFQSKFTLNSQYWDAFFFRQIGSYENFLRMYEKKKVFLITNSDSIAKIEKDRRLPLLWSFAIPKSHAFDSYNTLKTQILEKLSGIGDKKDMIIILAGGPMAKVLAYDLTTEYHYVCHDTGQFFDLFLV